MYNVTQYSLLPSSLPIRPTHPASQVTQSGLPIGGDKDTAIYTHTFLVIEMLKCDLFVAVHLVTDKTYSSDMYTYAL